MKQKKKPKLILALGAFVSATHGGLFLATGSTTLSFQKYIRNKSIIGKEIIADCLPLPRLLPPSLPPPSSPPILKQITNQIPFTHQIHQIQLKFPPFNARLHPSDPHSPPEGFRRDCGRSRGRMGVRWRHRWRSNQSICCAYESIIMAMLLLIAQCARREGRG